MTTPDSIIDLLSDEDSAPYIAARALTLACWEATDKVQLLDRLPDGCDLDSYIARRLLCRELQSSMPNDDGTCWDVVAGELLRFHVVAYLPSQSEAA